MPPNGGHWGLPDLEHPVPAVGRQLQEVAEVNATIAGQHAVSALHRTPPQPDSPATPHSAPEPKPFPSVSCRSCPRAINGVRDRYEDLKRSARFVMPSRDEWYKAAYHDASAGTEGVYFDYRTGSDDPPIPVTDGTEPGTAVYLQPESQGPAILTQAGGPSPYGTIGQGGNLYEYGEWFPRSVSVQPAVWAHGGLWTKGDHALFRTRRFGINPRGANADHGFRVAMLNPLGDFNEDGAIAAADIDLLSEALNDGSVESVFDLDQNDLVDIADHRFWVEQIAETHFGDADLNGTVEFADFPLLELSKRLNDWKELRLPQAVRSQICFGTSPPASKLTCSFFWFFASLSQGTVLCLWARSLMRLTSIRDAVANRSRLLWANWVTVPSRNP